MIPDFNNPFVKSFDEGEFCVSKKMTQFGLVLLAHKEASDSLTTKYHFVIKDSDGKEADLSIVYSNKFIIKESKDYIFIKHALVKFSISRGLLVCFLKRPQVEKEVALPSD